MLKHETRRQRRKYSHRMHRSEDRGNRKLKMDTMGIWSIPCNKNYPNRLANRALRRADPNVRQIKNGVPV